MTTPLPADEVCDPPADIKVQMKLDRLIECLEVYMGQVHAMHHRGALEGISWRGCTEAMCSRLRHVIDEARHG